MCLTKPPMTGGDGGVSILREIYTQVKVPLRHSISESNITPPQFFQGRKFLTSTYLRVIDKCDLNPWHS